MTISLPPFVFERLPGWEMISVGLADLAAGRVTPNACVAAIAAPRLRRVGIWQQRHEGHTIVDAELTLYRLLREAGGNAFGDYQARLRRLVRFEHAIDRLVAREMPSTRGAFGR